jgi:hypothetical protein
VSLITSTQEFTIAPIFMEAYMQKTKTILLGTLIFSMIILAAACGAGSDDASSGKPIKSGTAGNNLTVTLSSKDGVLRTGKQQIMLSFSDASGKPVDVGAAALNFYMPAMGSMSAMNSAATLTTTGTSGSYSATVEVEMAGEWQAQISYEGSAGKGKTNLPITAQ